MPIFIKIITFFLSNKFAMEAGIHALRKVAAKSDNAVDNGIVEAVALLAGVQNTGSKYVRDAIKQKVADALLKDLEER